MKYDSIIQDLESNIRYGRCHKLNKIKSAVNGLIESANPAIKKYCISLKPELEKMEEPYDLRSRILKSPEVDDSLDEITNGLISFIINNRNE